MSDAGGGNQGVVNQTFTFAQTALSPIPDATAPTTGTFRPVNYQNFIGDLIDTFPGPGPGALTDAAADLFVFNGINPNGIWNLYVVDDASGDLGSISGGWTLIFTVPQVFTVTKTADTNDSACNADCSLREALAAAQNGDLISFSSLFNTPQTINLLTALPDINRSITIQGPGANLLTVRRDLNAATDFRIFTIPGGVTNGVAISGVTITGGRDTGLVGGGGISSRSHLTLTSVHVTDNTAVFGGGVLLAVGADGSFTNSTFSNNSTTDVAGGGGGIEFRCDGNRTLRVVNSTVSGNSSANGGGIRNRCNNGDNNTSRLEVVNSTIAGNSAPNGGGIENVTQNEGSTATTTLRNTIIAGNTSNNLATSASGGTAAFQTLGFNLSDNYNGALTLLVSDITSPTPRLAPLALYGGQTPTHALLHSSPAFNAGDASGATTDQRGAARVFGANADIGAVEMRPRVVTSNANEGFGSLRNILSGIGSPFSDIQFENGFFSTPRTIMLTGGQLSIFGNANIIAPGANLLTISGNNNSRVFEVPSGTTTTLSGMTITGGNGSVGDGGGVFNEGNLTLTHSVVTGNQTSGGFSGGGIVNNGRLSVSNSTVSGNTSDRFGGGIWNSVGVSTVTNSTISGNTANGALSTSGGIDSSDSLTVTHSTISDNRAPNGNGNGGGIFSEGAIAIITNSTITNNLAAGANSASGVFRNNGTVNIRNSIIAGNVGNASQPDVIANGGTGITSNGFNLIGNRGTVTFGATDQAGGGGNPILNPLLGPLQNNGGTTATHALLGGSPALDAGQASGTTSDQRGSIRPFDFLGIANAAGSDGSDIGAFELQDLIFRSGFE